MRTLKFNNLVDTNTGKTVEVEVPDHIRHHLGARKRASDFAKRVAAVNDLRQVESLEEVAELGRVAGMKLFKEFGNEQARNNSST